jgi:MFS family permease
MLSPLAVVCVLTFAYYAGAQMRTVIIPLYGAAHGATPTWVGLIVGVHMAVAGGASIPLGHAADIWGRRPLLLGGIVVGSLASLLLPLVESPLAVMTIYGLAGLGVAAFSPSVLSLVGDVAAPGRAGHAYAWYATAHYGAIAVGPFLGGVLADWSGYRTAFIGSAIVIAVALAVGVATPLPPGAHTRESFRSAFATVRGDARVWGGWILSVSGMFVQGVLFTFFPLLAHEQGLTPGAIGMVFLVLGAANTLARLPAGRLMDVSGRSSAYAIAGVLAASMAIVALPHLHDRLGVLTLAAIFGAISGIAFVAISVGLAAASTPATRGLVMGGYSTMLYVGLALGSVALGPVVSHFGYGVGFAVGGITGVLGALAALLAWRHERPRSDDLRDELVVDQPRQTCSSARSKPWRDR